MFVEKLERKNIEEFAKQLHCSVSELKKQNNRLYIRLFTGAYGPQPELYLEDFACKTNEYYRHYEEELEKKWLNYLNEKFGKEYENEYKNYLNKKADMLCK